MKCVRGYEHDLETAVGIHRNQGLDLDTLVARYLDEMNHVIGDKARIDLNFRALIDRLYGESAEIDVTRLIRKRRAGS